MADNTIEREPGKLSLTKGKLGLSKGGDGGKIKQSFSHGRSKTVTVEVKRKRGPGSDQVGKGGRGSRDAGALSDEERAARLRALKARQTTPAAPVEPAKAEVVPAAALALTTAEDKQSAAEAQAHRELEEAAAIDTAAAAEKAARDKAAEPEPEPEAEPEVVAAEPAAESSEPAAAEPEAVASAPESAPVVAEAPEPAPAPVEPAAPAAPTSEELELRALQEAESEERRKADEIASRHAAATAKAEPEAPTSRRGGRGGRGGAAEAEPEVMDPRTAPLPSTISPSRGAVLLEEEEAARNKRDRDAKRPTPGRNRGEQRRRTGRLTITQALDDETAEERQRSLASVRRARERERQRQRQTGGDTQKIVRDVVVPEVITVQDLANRMAERAADVVRSLMKMGVMASLSQTIDADTAELIVEEFGHNIRRVADSDVEEGLSGRVDDDGEMVSRPPVVTIMGHVDHGKTSLLDALRQTDVASGEAGGITQHIGAYQVQMANGSRITFLDTPGHAAFSAMRSRGAAATDLVILVVAADDSVQPQTIEAVNHAKAAGVPIIVAVNKIDRPDVDPERVKTDLLQQEVISEDFGGDVQFINVSALKKIGLEELQEAILLQSELLELKANPNRSAQGIVVEAQLDRGRGSVATILVQRGTLRVGDSIVVGSEYGRVRAMIDERGQQLKEAGPSMPVEILGLQGTPMAGDEAVVVENEVKAREIAEYRQRRDRDKRRTAGARGTLEEMFDKLKAGVTKDLSVVIKTDVQGSQEAIVGALEKFNNEEVAVRVLHAGVGGINESDVTLSTASEGFVIGFNVRASKQAREMAAQNGVEIRYYSIIYELLDDIRASLSSMLAPSIRETQIGNAAIREVFNVTKVGKVAGCRVTNGIVRRGSGVRLLRDDVVIHEGKLATLKHFKDDVAEVRDGSECGMSFENYQDIQVGDVIECYEVEEVARYI
ncbi:MAG: translation initiation factor IF-2 [Alphaproteobacteria bacterium]|jgi:translation initiation factor IF-2